MGRRKRAEEEHENHERWLVSYADFITLLFAFFVVMYSLSSLNEGKYKVLSNSLMQAFRAQTQDPNMQRVAEDAASLQIIPPIVPQPPLSPEEAALRKQEVARMKNMADEIRRVLEPLARGGQVQVSEGARGIAVEINASVLFSAGDATLGSEANTALRAVAEVLANATFPIIVEGHTDPLPISNFRFPSNWELSSARASSVVRLFVESGVAPSRLTAAGYADQRPVAPNGSETERARNRRVTILIESLIGELRPTPPAGTLSSSDPLQSLLPPATPPSQ
jgi:chemotaxis protein MotB